MPRKHRIASTSRDCSLINLANSRGYREVYTGSEIQNEFPSSDLDPIQIGDSIMLIINYSVRLKSQCKLLLDWKIQALDPSTCTFREFFNDKLLSIVSYEQKRQLSAVYVGKSKADADLTDVDSPMGDTVGVFGRYVQFYIE